jgi:hypothetical protein
VPVWGAVAVPVWGVCPVGVVGCWASASDSIRTVDAVAKPNAANPRMEKALRREMISVSFFLVTINLPI